MESSDGFAKWFIMNSEKNNYSDTISLTKLVVVTAICLMYFVPRFGIVVDIVVDIVVLFMIPCVILFFTHPFSWSRMLLRDENNHFQEKYNKKAFFVCGILFLCLLWKYLSNDIDLTTAFNQNNSKKTLLLSLSCLLVSLNEELIFKACIYRLFLKLKVNRILCFLLPSLLFCIVHLPCSPVEALLHFSSGLLSLYLFSLYPSFVPFIVAHWLLDLFVVL